jgi:uncharacterized Zn finger protein
MGWWNRDYPPRKPRRDAHGIKAKTGPGKKFGQTWWGGKWLRALEQIVDPNRLQRGRSYARTGQILNLDFKGNSAHSMVQGSRVRPYEVHIEIVALTENAWDRAAQAMASQAIFAAKLLAGEMPQNIEEAFTAAGASLFPSRKQDLKTSCSCPDSANPCKHIAAVYYLLSEQFDADPFLLFQLRGRAKEELIQDLRRRRGAEGLEPAQPDESPLPDEEQFQPLAKSLDHFWEMGADLEELSFNIAAPSIDAAPLKLLGEPDFWEGKPDLASRMSEAYRSISDAALKLALGE